MTIPRKNQICLETTLWYHCTSRCVRRAFLCGRDTLSGKNFEHRRGWMEDRIHELTGVFALDLGAYAVMSNHYHVVLRVNQEEAAGWDAAEVAGRWRRLFEVPTLIQRMLSGESLSGDEQSTCRDIVEIWRARLASISWFMRCLSENIARLANAEEDCSGHFWEGRFKCQALLGESALLQFMTYVDLNPVRASTSDTPEEFEYTSVRARVRSELGGLMPFEDQAPEGVSSLPFDFAAYLELVDWTGRVVREDKRGAISEHVPPILERLNISPENWTRSVKHYGKRYYLAVGPLAELADYWPRLKRQWLKGKRFAEECFAT